VITISGLAVHDAGTGVHDQRNTQAKRVFVWLIIAGPLAACYAFGAFMAYAVWCGVVRGVDPGLGDWWGVPVGHGFSLSFIDVLDHAYISPRGSTDGEPLIANITEIGASGEYVFGLVNQGEGFVLNTRTGAVRRTGRAALPETLRDAGVSPTALTSVAEFYRKRRWGWQDVIALAVLGIPPFLVATRTLQRAWNGRSEQVA
jgi:hypothetical protein